MLGPFFRSRLNTTNPNVAAIESYAKAVCLVTKYFFLENVDRNFPFMACDPKEKGSPSGWRSGDVAVITGGTGGIGEHIIKHLLKRDMRVFMSARKIDNGKRVIDRMRSEGIKDGSVEIYQMDALNLSSVKSFCDTVKEQTSKVNLLFCNAGIMAVPYSLTPDGFESTFITNYLSHFLMTQLLLPELIEAGKQGPYRSRIVNNGSVAHYPGHLNFDDLQMKKFYDSFRAYYDSKLALSVDTCRLDRQLKAQGVPVGVFSAHPGICFTDLWVNEHWFISVARVLIQLIAGRTAETGADTLLYCGLHKDLELESGLYIERCRSKDGSIFMHDTQIQDSLFKASMDYCKPYL